MQNVNQTIMGSGDRTWAQVQAHQGQLGIYSQETVGMGSVDGKLLGDIESKGFLRD